jgi:F-type H+-transporting ATPase subunit b
LIGLILFFIGLVVVTNALIFKPIFKALDERSSRVEGARQRAEEADLESDALLQRYEAAIHEARNEAETKRKNKLGHAREEQLGMAEVARGQAEAQVEAARETLAAALATAREGLKATSREIAQAVATRVIGRDL